MFSWSPGGLQVSNHELILALIRAKSAAKVVFVCTTDPLSGGEVNCLYINPYSGLYSTLQYPIVSTALHSRFLSSFSVCSESCLSLVVS